MRFRTHEACAQRITDLLGKGSNAHYDYFGTFRKLVFRVLRGP